jgi:hypothetical protein
MYLTVAAEEGAWLGGTVSSGEGWVKEQSRIRFAGSAVRDGKTGKIFAGVSMR